MWWMTWLHVIHFRSYHDQKVAVTQRHGGEGPRLAPGVDVEQARQRGVRQEAVAEDGRAGLQGGLRVAVPPHPHGPISSHCLLIVYSYTFAAYSCVAYVSSLRPGIIPSTSVWSR